MLSSLALAALEPSFLTAFLHNAAPEPHRDGIKIGQLLFPASLHRILLLALLLYTCRCP